MTNLADQWDCYCHGQNHETGALGPVGLFNYPGYVCFLVSHFCCLRSVFVFRFVFYVLCWLYCFLLSAPNGSDLKIFSSPDTKGRADLLHAFGHICIVGTHFAFSKYNVVWKVVRKYTFKIQKFFWLFQLDITTASVFLVILIDNDKYRELPHLSQK